MFQIITKIFERAVVTGIHYFNKVMRNIYFIRMKQN